MIQDYPDDWIDAAIARVQSENYSITPAKKNGCRAKMIAIREAARSAPVIYAPNIRPSDDEDIKLALYLRAGDLLGTNRKSGMVRA